MQKDYLRNREYVSQVVNYAGLNFGKTRPTDIDAMIEYHDKAFIFYELKYGDGEMPTGQRLALTRLVDNLATIKPTLLVVCSHKTSYENEIYLKDAIVTKYRRGGVWRTPPKPKTVYEITESFLSWVDEGSKNKWHMQK